MSWALWAGVLFLDPSEYTVFYILSPKLLDPETPKTKRTESQSTFEANFEDNDGISAVHWFGRASDLSNTSWSALRGSILGRQSCVTLPN